MDNLYSSFYLYRKYEVIGDELIDLGITSIDGDGTQEPVVKSECDPACGCVTYRWVQTEDTVCIEVITRETSGETYCVDFDKYVDVTIEESIDGGETWEFVSSSSTLVEANSRDCGYVQLKYKIKLNDDSIVTAQCNSDSALRRSEISRYYNSAVSLEIGDCVTAISTGVCEDFTGLTSVTIPNSVTSIGSSAFTECTNLKNITIPDSVTTIGALAFYRCSGSTSVEIGSGVTRIGDNAFRNCSGLTAITINATTPPTVGSDTFTNTNNSSIFVPCESVVSYWGANNWNNYDIQLRLKGIPPCVSPITEYFSMIAEGDGTIRFVGATGSGGGRNYGYYSRDGINWSEPYYDITVSVITGDRVYWKSSWSSGQAQNLGRFYVTCPFSVRGNILSLINGYPGGNGRAHACEYLLKGTPVTNAEDLVLPKGGTDAYWGMFQDCTSLVKAPKKIHAAGEGVCNYMFDGCTSLTTPPTRLEGNSRYQYCYMFMNCTSLRTAPILTATNPQRECYYSMFTGCVNLNAVTCLATDISEYDVTYRWLSNVSSTGTFTKPASTTGWTRDSSGIPSGWVIVDIP